jgi:hypothetical protein
LKTRAPLAGQHFAINELIPAMILIVLVTRELRHL